jgi:hypothetical protein
MKRRPLACRPNRRRRRFTVGKADTFPDPPKLPLGQLWLGAHLAVQATQPPCQPLGWCSPATVPNSGQSRHVPVVQQQRVQRVHHLGGGLPRYLDRLARMRQPRWPRGTTNSFARTCIPPERDRAHVSNLNAAFLANVQHIQGAPLREGSVGDRRRALNVGRHATNDLPVCISALVMVGLDDLAPTNHNSMGKITIR